MSDSTESPNSSKAASKKRTSKRCQNLQPSEHESTQPEQAGAKCNCACTGHITTETTINKLDKIIASLDSMDSRLTGLEVQLHEVTAKVKIQTAELEDLKPAMSDIETWRKTIVLYINQRHDYNYSEVSVLKNHIDDLQNHSQRNNIIVYGIPVGSENGQKCENFMSAFFTQHMQLDGGQDIEIKRAHRTPGHRSPASSSSRPRPIHCRLLRSGDREYILKNASKTLRNNPYNKSKIFITDDVTELIRYASKSFAFPAKTS